MKRLVACSLAICLLALGGLRGEGYSQNASPKTTPAAAAPGGAAPLTLPVKEGSVRFLVIGDTGSGSKEQKQLSEVMMRYRQAFPFEFVLMMGDNLYGSESPKDYDKKFEDVYRELINTKVKFYATLGNHDTSNQRFYEHFNMDGQEYYTFKSGNVRFYSLNSNYMDKRQIEWFEKEVSKDDSEWKIVFFHHPPYSSGKKHGSDEKLREVVEPIFIKHGVNVVFAGHEHFYERIKPQKGIYYFISGAGGKLRAGDVKATQMTAKAFDQDLNFMLVEIAGDQMHFQVITRAGKTVDSGVLTRQSGKALKAAD